ncbi:hypothetical protein [Gryllotalpicola daejeonensis]
MTDEPEERETKNAEDQSEQAARGSEDQERRISAAPPTEAIILKSSD